MRKDNYYNNEINKRSLEKTDIVGTKFNMLTAVKRIYDGKKEVRYLFSCDCGNQKIILKHAVVSGRTKSCGCLSKKETSKRSFKDLTGQTFGRLTVVSLNRKTKLGSYWNCKCICGNDCVVLTSKLSNGHTTSCGCKKIDTHNKIANINKSHNLSNTKLYKIYMGMKARCYRESASSYMRYGARGIKVCDEWIDDFTNFYNWSIENGYKPGLSIDRIDSNGNYEPSNCRWSTPKEQANNTRKTIFLTYQGETKSASEWSEIIGISQNTIARRKRDGWTDEECLTIKIGEKRA